MDLLTRQQIVWAFNSPPLLASSHFPSLIDHEQLKLPEEAIEALDVVESADHLLRQNDFPARLGKFFELLISAGLRCHPLWRERQKNLIIQNDDRTIGEIDLIVEHVPTARIEHWEVAVKFYLGIEPLDDPAHWFGPRLTDRLAIKLNKLFHQQLPLAQWAQRAHKLPDTLPEIVQSKVLVKGRLFYPLAQRNKTVQFAHAQHERGVWATVSQWRAWSFSQPGVIIVPLLKHDWLLPNLSEQNYIDFKEWLLYESERLTEPKAFYLHARTWSQMIFVTPDEWPDEAREKISDAED